MFDITKLNNWTDIREQLARHGLALNYQSISLPEMHGQRFGNNRLALNYQIKPLPNFNIFLKKEMWKSSFQISLIMTLVVSKLQKCK